MATIQQNSAVGEEQNQQQSEFRNTTNSELEVEKRPLTFVQVIWLQIMGMGIFFSMLAAIAWIFLKRVRNTTQKMDAILDREWIFQANQPDCTIPPPMEIMSTDSLTRWTGNRRRDKTPVHSPCICPKDPLPSLNPIVFV